jgi:hypothetical protein
MPNPHRSQFETQLRKITPQYLGHIVIETTRVILFGIKAQHAARSGARGPPSPLLR